jgi:Tfp pilus assembly protein PilF
LNNDTDLAADDLNKAYTLNGRNPAVTLGLAKLHFTKNNYTSAKEYIQSTKVLDPDGVFGEQADELLKKIENPEIIGSGALNMSGSVR